jgi:hypothetical protein
MRSSSSETYFVNFKFDYKHKELLKEILELGISAVFPHITMHCVFLPLFLHQWLQVNELPVCRNRLSTVTVQLKYKIVSMFSLPSISTVTAHES